jgi:hypothetical protein
MASSRSPACRGALLCALAPWVARASSIQHVHVTLDQMLRDAPVVLLVHDDPTMAGSVVVEEVVRDPTGRVTAGQALTVGRVDLDPSQSFFLEPAPDGTVEWPVFFVYQERREGVRPPDRRLVYLAPRGPEDAFAEAVEGAWDPPAALPRVRGALAAAGTGLLSLTDLAGPPPGGLTTAMLSTRGTPGPADTDGSAALTVSTSCGPEFCVDGLHDDAFGRWLVPASVTLDEAPILAADGWLDRRVFLATASLQWVSAFVGLSEFSGGAHANNDLACRTFDRRTGRPARLADVVGEARSAELLARAAVTADADYTPRDDAFLVGPDDAITLCAEAPFCMAGTTWRIPVAAMMEPRPGD